MSLTLVYGHKIFRVKFKVICRLLAFLILSLSSGFAPVTGIIRIMYSCCSSLVDLFARDDDVISFISLFFFTGGRGEGGGGFSVRVLGVVSNGVPPWEFSHSICLISWLGVDW